MSDPITPDERAAMRKRARWGGYTYPTDVLRLLDALDAADAEVDLLKAEIRRDLARFNGPERNTPQGAADAVVDVYPFHMRIKGLPDLFHASCRTHPEFGMCGTEQEAEAAKAAHLATHEEPTR